MEEGGREFKLFTGALLPSEIEVNELQTAERLDSIFITQYATTVTLHAPIHQ